MDAGFHNGHYANANEGAPLVSANLLGIDDFLSNKYPGSGLAQAVSRTELTKIVSDLIRASAPDIGG
jgi:hypothetical protein